jgi:hypothetical protein
MKTLVVKVPADSAVPFAVSRLRDVGEDIYKEFFFSGVADVPNMDTAIDTLHIHIHKTRHLGDVSAALKKSLRKQGLENVEIARAD